MTKGFDLEERTARFGEEILKFCQTIKPTLVSDPLIRQIIRSATSIGANYMEANGADSKADFRAKISICKKESKETMHWLRMLKAVFSDKQAILEKYWNEAHELSLIFGAINRPKLN